MSLTSIVPDGVPSVRHTSRPWAAVLATKNVTPLTFVNPLVVVLTAPVRLMSLTSVVPDLAPLDFHSSVPKVTFLARKKSVPPTFVSKYGSEVDGPKLMSRTRFVPSAVPLVFHN